MVGDACVDRQDHLVTGWADPLPAWWTELAASNGAEAVQGAFCKAEGWLWGSGSRPTAAIAESRQLHGLKQCKCWPGAFGRLRQVDHLRSGVRDQPDQHDETLSLKKKKK